MRLGLYGPHGSVLLASLALAVREAGGTPVFRTNRNFGPHDLEKGLAGVVVSDEAPNASDICQLYHKAGVNAGIIHEEAEIKLVLGHFFPQQEVGDGGEAGTEPVPAGRDEAGDSAPADHPGEGRDAADQLPEGEVTQPALTAEALEAMDVADVRATAQARGLNVVGKSKAKLIELILAQE